MKTIETAYAEIRERVGNAARKSGRSPEDVEIMAVTKTHTVETIRSAYDTGIRLFGENRVQEAVRKYDELPNDLTLHLVGHLQRNKAKLAVGLFDCIESIDKISTLNAVTTRLPENEPIDVLIEVNTSHESSKYGVPGDEELYSLVDEVIKNDRATLRGLMTIAPFTDDDATLRKAFSYLRDLHEQTKNRYELDLFDTLSMGMSSDFETAIEEGATRVRIGTALFGHRSG